MKELTPEQMALMAKELAKKMSGLVKEIQAAAADAEKEADTFEAAAAAKK